MKLRPASKINVVPQALIPVLLILIAGYVSSVQASEGDAQYKQFSMEKVTCETAVLYKATAERFDIAVSAIAYGKGAEFRKWVVTDIKLNIGSRRIKADKSAKFYVLKESLFRYPAAIVFAAIGAAADAPGAPLSEGITRAGRAVGLGLLVAQAKGEIEGYNCTFQLTWDVVHKISEERDSMEVSLEDPERHLKESVKIGIKEIAAEEARFNYSNMGQKTLQKIIDVLKSQIGTLEKVRDKYKNGIDPEYAEMQKKIEGLEVERAQAYRVWFDRGGDESVDSRP